MLEPTEKISGELHESLDYFTRHDLWAGSIERRLFFLKMLEINSKMNLSYGWNKDREAPLVLYSFHVARRLLEKVSTEELAI